MLYPTVAHAQLNVQNNMGENIRIQLLDASGRLVLQRNIAMGANSISIENMSAGTYHYILLSENRSILKSGQIIKQ
jgi:hypothetical protein